MSTETTSFPKITKAFEQVGAHFPVKLQDRHQRILQRIELIWGESETLKYLNSLLLEDREDREGFPLEIISEIVSIKQVHDTLFPLLDTNPLDPFTSARILPFTQNGNGHTAVPIENDVLGFNSEQIEYRSTKKRSVATAHAFPEHIDTRIPWPKVKSQHELLEKIRQLQTGDAHLYEQQGQLLGDILVYYHLINEKHLTLLSQMKGKLQHQSIGQILVDMSIISKDDLTCALCVQAGVIMVDILSLTISSETDKLVTFDTVQSKQALPVTLSNNTLYLATSDPFSSSERSFFNMLTGLRTELVYAPRNDIIKRINKHGMPRSLIEGQEAFRSLAKKTLESTPHFMVAKETVNEEITENDSAIINLVNQIILNALEEDASDIHIELFQGSKESDIRFRRDGHMEHFSEFPGAYHRAVISRIKIMAELDIAEKRHPQDGKISFPLRDGRRVDLRVASVPTIHGTEFITIRVLPSGEPLPLDRLGMSARDMEMFRELFQRPYGLILVCGPTGSGKTTTLHSVLKELNTVDRKIWTAEDPVEIVQPHLCQVQINSKIGLTFADILHAFLRADPDIIMIGEMRDKETASIALEASMTGHLVLSTLHTNSASETVARLIDLGIDPFNLSDALLAIVAQRLARLICPACAQQEEISARELEDLAIEYHLSAHLNPPSLNEREAIIRHWRDRFGQDDGRLYLKQAVGCKACNGGYKGRIGLYELLRATPTLRHMVRQHSSGSEYLQIGIDEGMRTLKQDGIEKVLAGLTDMAQVHSACI
ncbi:MAG: GspE/PulE family protein [Gallionella sp.]|nr:GspE/PulE family protein [Gallionella sp.]